MPTYYVDSAATGAADGSSEADAWTTIDTAMNNVIAGDLVYVKASGTYSETPNIDTAGAATNNIIFEGYSSTPGDNGKVTITGTTHCLTGSTTSTYYTFKNFIFSGASNYGVNLATEDYVQFYNCEFNNNGSHGINGDNNFVFVSCTATGNNGIGIDVDSSPIFLGCVSYANAFQQIVCANSTIIYKCVVYGSTGSSSCIESQNSAVAIGNTVDGENLATVGIEVESTFPAVAVDNIVYDCVTGINLNAAAFSSGVFTGYNLMNSNTTDYSASSGNLVGINDVSTAPAFTSESTDDYTLGEASPAIGAGLTPGGIT